MIVSFGMPLPHIMSSPASPLAHSFFPPYSDIYHGHLGFNQPGIQIKATSCRRAEHSPTSPIRQHRPPSTHNPTLHAPSPSSRHGCVQPRNICLTAALCVCPVPLRPGRRPPLLPCPPCHVPVAPNPMATRRVRRGRMSSSMQCMAYLWSPQPYNRQPPYPHR